MKNNNGTIVAHLLSSQHISFWNRHDHTVIILILQKGKLRLREAMQLSQGHTANPSRDRAQKLITCSCHLSLEVPYLLGGVLSPFKGVDFWTGVNKFPPDPYIQHIVNLLPFLPTSPPPAPRGPAGEPSQGWALETGAAPRLGIASSFPITCSCSGSFYQ